jgi:pimeloyl-ACP methyl ester carboxylesterase
MNLSTLPVAGAALEYRWAGDNDSNRPCIVLLHEGLGSTAMWKGFPDALARRTGSPVLVYSRQGYGWSAPLSGPRQPDYMHLEGEVVLPAVLDAAGVDRAVLFGHSDGASIALLGAARFPDRVAGLVLEAPHVFVEPLTIDSIAQSRRIFETTDLRDKLARYHRDPEAAFWGWNDIWLDERFRQWNIEAALAGIRAPMLLLQGRQDEYGTEAQLKAIQSQAGGPAEVVMLDNCGHSPHRDQMQMVLRHAGDFIAALGAAEAA